MPLVNDNTSGSDVINNGTWLTRLRSHDNLLNDLTEQAPLAHGGGQWVFQITSECDGYLKRLNAEPVIHRPQTGQTTPLDRLKDQR